MDENMNAVVTVISGNDQYKYNIKKGGLLFEALGGKHDISAVCGGKGLCGKCRVKAVGMLDEPSEHEKKLLGNAAASNIRLACLAHVLGDVTVTLDSNNASIAVAGERKKFKFSPAAEEVYIELTTPTLENPISAVKNFKEAIMRTTGKDVKIPFSLYNDCGKFIDEGKKVAYVVIANDELVAIYDEAIDLFGIAVDIGTTTVAVYLCDLKSGEVIGTAALENPQKSTGADVISRIQYIIEHDGALNTLGTLVSDALNEKISLLCKNHNADINNVMAVAIAGNTVMEHIFARHNPASIASAPFSAETLFGEFYKADSLGIKINPNGVLYMAPCVASYVGGDITAGVVAAGLYGASGTHLYIDIGTNGEMGLLHDGKFIFCATAAGPAFEGAHIDCGMSGVDGAVRAVEIDENGDIKLDVISGDKCAPKGICGSGIIDAAASFLELGLIDETGSIMCSDEVDENLAKYTDEDGEQLSLTEDGSVYLCGSDIREIQLAKSAVAAGIETLLDFCGISTSDVDSVLLAGGFGSHIRPESACKIGLIPEELLSKIKAVGNTAGMGAVSMLLSDEAIEQTVEVAFNSTYLELSGNPKFMDEFVEKMMF